MDTIFTDYIDEISPSAKALADDRETITYGELRNRAGQVATYLQMYYGRKNYMLLKAYSSVDFVITLLGILYSGNIPIPIAPNSPSKVLSYLAKKACTTVILNPIKQDSYGHLKSTYAASGDQPCLVMFTSGTSGYPKGVLISHNNLVHSCKAVATYLDYYRYRSAAVVLPMYYSYGLLSQVLCQLMIGGFNRLFPEFRNVLKFKSIVNELGLETFCGVPSTYVTLAKVYELKAMEMPSIKILCSAGAAMNMAVFPQIKRIFPNSVFFNNYGMTEAAPRISFINEKDPRFFESTCGRAIYGIKTKVVDPEALTDKLEGEQGMLVVKGPNITQGYLNDAEQTVKAFTRDGYLITGDIARIENEYIFILGRHDDIFNVGGEKVSPIEIEQELNKIPQVEISAVVGMSDGNRGSMPVAFLILKERISRSKLTETLAEVLNSWKIPNCYYEVSELPMTPNGKIQRKRLDINDFYVLGEIR